MESRLSIRCQIAMDSVLDRFASNKRFWMFEEKCINKLARQCIFQLPIQPYGENVLPLKNALKSARIQIL